MSVGDAVAWLRAVQIAETYGEIGRLAAPLIREDDARRYAMASDIKVKTPDDATVCAMVWRPRTGPSRLPALLQFTIYADTASLLGDLRRNASNSYAAVIGFTRGKACSSDAPVPYVHDGADAVALIDWISRQPWSDGPRRHVRRQLLGHAALGGGQARATGAEGHHGRRAGGAWRGRADGGEHCLELRLSHRSLPPYQSRASYVGDITRRRLLTPGAPERLDWKNVRLTSHFCEAGSRIVMVLGVLRSPGQQINYGTGRDVNAETVADAGAPLAIQWSNRSYLELPVWRPPGAGTAREESH